MDATARLTTRRPPVWTLLISACAMLTFIVPALRTLMIYDRAAIARGELWRLVTGNLVHFSASHLFFDLTAFIISGAIIEAHGYRRFPTLCLAAATLIGVVLYCAEPAMYFYAGLSGVAMAAVTYLCLHGLAERGTWRRLCAAVLIGVTAKLGLELASGRFFLFEVSAQEFLPVPLSHLVGIITALILFALVRYISIDSITTLHYRIRSSRKQG